MPENAFVHALVNNNLQNYYLPRDSAVSMAAIVGGQLHRFVFAEIEFRDPLNLIQLVLA
jgi:hypothetical protein